MPKNKNNMENLYLLQFACFLFMLFNVLVLGITRLHMKWLNRRYEQSRWLILTALVILAMQYLTQMLLGFRAKGDAMGAVCNMLVYPPCFSLIAIGIYNIEATHANRRRMNIVCASIYAAILSAFSIGYSQSGSFHIGNWLYVMNVLFGINIAYCIYMIVVEMRKRKQMLEEMAGYDILPFVRYARASVFLLFLPALTIPFAVLFTKSLYIVGPLGLFAVLFFMLSFVALGYNYVPAEGILNKEEEEAAAIKSSQMKDCRMKDSWMEDSWMKDCQMKDDQMTDCQQESVEDATDISERQEVIRQKLEAWCDAGGYRDTSLNMVTLSRSLNLTKNELSRYLSSCLNTTFRIWLAEVRFEAAKKMMLESPDFGNDIISAECGFSSRTHLYRMFKEKEGCSPTAWRTQNVKKSI